MLNALINTNGHLHASFYRKSKGLWQNLNLESHLSALNEEVIFFFHFFLDYSQVL